MARQLPEALLSSLEGLPGFSRESFARVHEAGAQVTSVRINPSRTQTGIFRDAPSGKILSAEKIPWTSFGYYLSERPSFTFDPLFHAGNYYVQEASGMFLEQAFRQLVPLNEPIRVLDLCGAPGGKSTHIHSLISSDSLLVSNEVIRQRSLVLQDNVLKWGCRNVIVTNNDPSVCGRMPGFFDVLVIDAPCSGSGLFRRDPEAIGEWSLNNVQLCHQRQQRILADALPCLKEGGLLVYSTCSFSREEDEEIMEWLTGEMGMTGERLELDPDWNIVETLDNCGAAGYRFYPDRLKGEGFFLACFRKTEEVKTSKQRQAKLATAGQKVASVIRPFVDVQPEGLSIFEWKEQLHVMPEGLMEQLGAVMASWNVVYAGTRIGQVMKDRLVPDHALALSGLVGAEVPRTALSYADAIRYLQRKEIRVEGEKKGWSLAVYEENPLGWINILANRVNNYYPKELRILKESPESSEK
jgi:16S rRNA C967 or C1407 C5-methylase (RsmB/RsmF family)/NOL1/NOP2/fmu family ribosome biogenesis protein